MHDGLFSLNMQQVVSFLNMLRMLYISHQDILKLKKSECVCFVFLGLRAVA